jgi:hypothetical protein
MKPQNAYRAMLFGLSHRSHNGRERREELWTLYYAVASNAMLSALENYGSHEDRIKVVDSARNVAWNMLWGHEMVWQPRQRSKKEKLAHRRAQRKAQRKKAE